MQAKPERRSSFAFHRIPGMAQRCKAVLLRDKLLASERTDNLQHVSIIGGIACIAQMRPIATDVACSNAPDCSVSHYIVRHEKSTPWCGLLSKFFDRLMYFLLIFKFNMYYVYINEGLIIILLLIIINVVYKAQVRKSIKCAKLTVNS